MKRDGWKEGPIGSWRREARLNFKPYLLIFVKEAIHRGPAETVVDSVSLCASAQKYQHEDSLPNGDIPESLHRNQKWKQLNTLEARRRDRTAKLQEYFATQLHKLLDVWSLFFLLSTWANSLPSHKFQGFSLAMERPLNSTPFPNQCQASGLHHIAGGPRVLLFSQALSSTTANL